MSIYDVRKSILEPGTIVVTLYRNARFLIGKTSIIPFREDMKDSNGVTLFLDYNDNITGGQISKYDSDNGIQCIVF